MASKKLWRCMALLMVTDVDSSCFKKILDRDKIFNIKVEKLECRNVLFSIMKWHYAVTKETEYWKFENTTKVRYISDLGKHILNSSKHILGDHSESTRYFGYVWKIPTVDDLKSADTILH